MTQSRESFGLGPFLRAHRLAKPGNSSIKLYAMFLSDRDPGAMKQKAMDLYTMQLGWHNLIKIEM